jgi:hypothetical protein
MEKFKFRSEHFYNLLKTQDYKCYLTNRELRPENSNAEHIKRADNRSCRRYN